MSNSYRIRTEVGKDKSIRVQLDQDFEFLEILSLKLLQSQIYIRPCSDYGVVVGRVSVNDGYGLPNCKVSIFIPLTDEDELNPIIADLYPYKSLTDVNDDGYRYNLLPYKKSFSAHKPTGTFFTREDVLTDTNLIEVYDKYFKYTAITNDSGDFMIFGVPVGTQTIHLDVDLSDIGEFSLNPQDLIRMGMATEAQLSGVEFRSSTNLATLPQIVSINKTIEVEPFWGQEQICNIGITRIDFDLTSELNIRIIPNAIFMGSIISDTEELALKRSCRPKFNQGELCQLVAGPGTVLAIRQTVFLDVLGRPSLESVNLLQQDIDDNGTWLIDVPMNLDYVYTNEFGEKVLSSDPKVGVPTKGKYRFKIKWAQSKNINEDTRRAYFLVPNIREYGYDITGKLNKSIQQQSYSFSTDWDDYGTIGTTLGEKMIQDAIDCNDTFYMMTYNKVYTVSQIIDRFRKGTKPNRIVSIKHILDETCQGENYKFPTNDVYYRSNFFILIMTFLFYIARPILLALLFVLHVLYMVVLILKILVKILAGLAGVLALYETGMAAAALLSSPPNGALALQHGLAAAKWALIAIGLWALSALLDKLKLKPINLPLMLYNQCEFCDCKDAPEMSDDSAADDTIKTIQDITDIQNLGGSTSSGAIPNLFLTTNYNTKEIESDQKTWGIMNSVLAGKPVKDQKNTVPICGARTPELIVDYTGNIPYNGLSVSLSLAERINLFNVKAKYFDENPNNPQGGKNRITVKVEPTMNFDLNPSLYHQDNIILLLLNKDSIKNLTQGKIITFQDPFLNKDINCTGSIENQFNNTAITGTNSNLTSINITYTQPNPPYNSQTVTYSIPSLPASASTEYHKFPTDLEYFQVITAMTYSNFNSQCGNQIPNSLNFRFLDNNMRITKLSNNFFNRNQIFGVGPSPTFTITPSISFFDDNPLQSIIDYQNLVVVMLVRGVDPYSPRFQIQYDLGRIFGYNSPNAVSVIGDYKLNIPINGKFLNVQHNLSSSSASNGYSGMKLYHNTFFYKPDPIKFSAFNSNLHTYYSSLDNQTSNTIQECQLSCPSSMNLGAGSNIHNFYGRRVSNLNSFAYEWNTQHTIPILNPNPPPPPVINIPTAYWARTPNFTSNISNNRGYQKDEIIEGGSIMIANASTPINQTGLISYSSTYISPTYPRIQMLFDGGGSLQSFRQLVMRSDRLPTSTTTQNNCDSFLPLETNANFSMYAISDDGYESSEKIEQQASMSDNEQEDTDKDEGEKNQTVPNSLIKSLNNCSDAAPLGCYKPKNDGSIEVQTGQCRKFLGKDLMKGGCYQFVTTPLLSLIRDVPLLTEWISRTSITFAACNNVFSHIFTNNWINGTLYAFAYKNAVFYDNANIPSNNYCSDLIYFNNKTNNFYYRSSPYTEDGRFIGINVGTTYGRVGKNSLNLLFPTTIMDLGPVNYYTKELILTGDYEGYVMDQLKPTTFNSVTDILNILILSRLANSNFLSKFFGFGGASIFTYFNRPFKAVDGDYPQMISINSELGVSEFEAENYPDPLSGPKPVYFSSASSSKAVFGIFFSSDTQLRDYITPKREIINGDSKANPTTPLCTFDYYSVFTQDVPYYQWEQKNEDPNSIFGAQDNDWYTIPNVFNNNNSFLHVKYQTLDRTIPNHRYFRNKDGQNANKHYKGYIYATNNGSLSYNVNDIEQNSPLPRVITVGAPFHFYFGLKKGKSALDRFIAKYIGIAETPE